MFHKYVHYTNREVTRLRKGKCGLRSKWKNATLLTDFEMRAGGSLLTSPQYFRIPRSFPLVT